MLVDLIKEFQLWNPDLVKMMKDCDHHYSDTSLNDYHICGDVWTHTCLAYNQLIQLKIPDYTFRLLSGISVLCHDIGKIYTRHSPKPERIAMYNHSFASIQDTIQFIKYLNKNDWFKNTELSSINEVYYHVLNPISNHMDYHNVALGKQCMLSNNDLNVKLLSDVLCYCDTLGSITHSNEHFDMNIPHLKSCLLDDWNWKINILKECDIILMCGSPASGKDTLANNMFSNSVILSYDDIRMEIYNEKIGFDYNLSYNERYRQSFEYCRDKKINLNNYLFKKIKLSINNGNKVVISNTNLTRKGRRSLINIIRNDRDLKINTIGACFICSDKNELYKRDQNRNKTIGKNVIDKFVKNQQIPTIKEGFDLIEFVDN